VELAALKSFVNDRSSKHIGLLAPARSPRFRRTSWYFAYRRPPQLSSWVHPLKSFTSPAEFSGSYPPGNLSAPSTFLGVSSPSRHQPAESTTREHPKLASFRPRRFSRPRRFAPPPALRVYFTPQPRPGFILQGFSLRHSRTTSSVAVALLSFDRTPYHRLAPIAPEMRPRLQGLAPCRSP
jgi:hypothetical protein